MVTAVIPARGGSEGVPRKALAKMPDGKTMLQLAIENAKEADVDKIIVTTEDFEYADHAANLGAFVVKRPEHLSHPKVHASRPAIHALQEVDTPDDEEVFLLLPTCPLRTEKHVLGALASFRAHPGPQSVIGITECSRINSLRYRRSGNSISPVDLYSEIHASRQEAETVYKVNGSLFLTRYISLKTQGSFHVPICKGFVMHKWQSIDVDTPADLQVAQLLYAQENITL